MNSNLKMEMLSSKELEQILGGTVVKIGRAHV